MFTHGVSISSFNSSSSAKVSPPPDNSDNRNSMKGKNNTKQGSVTHKVGVLCCEQILHEKSSLETGGKAHQEGLFSKRSIEGSILVPATPPEIEEERLENRRKRELIPENGSFVPDSQPPLQRTNEELEIRRAALEALTKSLSPLFYLTREEIAKVDIAGKDIQVLGEAVPKAFWYRPGQGYVVSLIGSPGQLENEHVYNAILKESAAARNAYWSLRNKLFAMLLQSSTPGKQTEFLSVGENYYFIECSLFFHEKTSLFSPNKHCFKSFKITAEKIRLGNLSLEQASFQMMRIETLLPQAKKYGEASILIDSYKKLLLSCSKGPDDVFSLSLHDIDKIPNSLPEQELLNLLRDVERSTLFSNAVRREKKVFLLLGTKDQYGAISVQEKEIFLSLSQGIGQTKSLALENLIDSLWEDPSIDKPYKKPPMSELLTQANEVGKASLFVPWGKNIYRLTASKKGTSFVINSLPLKLRPDEFEALHDVKAIDASSLTKKIQDMYQRVFSTLPKKGILQFERKYVKEPLSNSIFLYFSLKRGKITLGTEKLIGKGGIKTALKVVRIGLKIKTYVRAFASNPKNDGLLRQEAAIMQRLNHPLIVKLLGYSKRLIASGSQFFLKMDYYPQGSAVRFVHSPPKGQKEEERRLMLLFQAAQGLAYIHKMPGRLAHMDFKPENILLAEEEGKLVAKVGDLNPKEEGKKSAALTWSFADLEALTLHENKKPVLANQAYDVWSLGLTFFECFYGKSLNPLPEAIKATDGSSLNQRVQSAHTKLLLILNDTLTGKRINDLIRATLTLDRSSRPTLEALLKQARTSS